MPTPTPEVVTHMQHSLFDYVFLGGGFITMAISAYLGLVRLGARFDAYKESNDRDHEEIKTKLDAMNGQIDANAIAIAERAAVCEERHP